MFPLNIPENILLFISGFGLVQGFLLAAILYYHPRTDKSVTSFLSIYILCISIPILLPVAQQLFSWQYIVFVEPFTVLIGPALYFYVCSFRQRITLRKAWPHLIIFFVYIVIAFLFYTQVGLKYPFSSKVPAAAARHPLSYIP